MLALASVGVLFAASATFDALVSRVELWPDGRIRVRLPTFRGLKLARQSRICPIRER